MNAVDTPERPDAAQLLRMLQAACSERHPENWGRAARSPLCWQELEVFALAPQGAYRYHVHAHRLGLVQPQDLRACARADRAAASALELVYVADIGHLQTHPEEHGVYAGASADGLAQEVAQRCAGRGWRTSVARAFDRKRLHGALRLKPTQRIVLVQRVGARAPEAAGH